MGHNEKPIDVANNKVSNSQKCVPESKGEKIDESVIEKSSTDVECRDIGNTTEKDSITNQTDKNTLIATKLDETKETTSSEKMEVCEGDQKSDINDEVGQSKISNLGSKADTSVIVETKMTTETPAKELCPNEVVNPEMNPESSNIKDPMLAAPSSDTRMEVSSVSSTSTEGSLINNASNDSSSSPMKINQVIESSERSPVSSTQDVKMDSDDIVRPDSSSEKKENKVDSSGSIEENKNEEISIMETQPSPKKIRMSAWEREKERLAGLTLEARRRTYHCSPRSIVQLSDIPTWEEQYLKEKKGLGEMLSEKDRTIFSADFPDLMDENKKEDIAKLARKVSLHRGDITKLEVGAIVNAANKSLLGGGGVDGAIHRAAGDLLLSECRTLNGCETGNSKMTSGYKLPSNNIIHTVGPMGRKPDLLESCYEKSLKLLVENGLRTIAFPCISTGIYGYPSKDAVLVALKTTRKFLQNNFEKVDRIIFTLFLQKDVDVYEKQMQLFFPVSEAQKESAKIKDDKDELAVKGGDEKTPDSTTNAPTPSESNTKNSLTNKESENQNELDVVEMDVSSKKVQEVSEDD